VADRHESGDVRWRVFVSHTSELRDFSSGGSYVAAVERAISACGHVIVDMADFPAADLPAAELCRERVRSCDVYVGVLGTRFGSVVPDMPQVSYTELEFGTATEAGLPRLVFMLDTGAALVGIPLSGPAGLEPDGRQEEFRRRVQAGLVTRSFTNPAMLGQLVERSLRELTVLKTRAMTRSTAGRLLAEVTDPFALEVHRPVQPDTPQPNLPVLPVYVPREHDTDLERVVMAALQGTSSMTVLVGGSSTGKTRACWEALQLLRDRKPGWRLWHPIDPSRPEAALRDLPSIGPRTVVWLNEAQFYLDVAAGGLGERVAAGLRELLRDPARAPVLVLATLWPEFWGRLTARLSADVADPYAQAREFLSGRDISVPAAFTAAQRQQLVDAADPRLARAAEAAEGGQVIQFLAGAPELLARYRNAPPPAAALISAAIDARRLGMGIALPLAFLEAATSGYLTDTEWDFLGEDWLEQALAYTAALCKGVRGPLASIRPRINASAILAPGPVYRLADYLEQYGRRARRQIIPPADFWTAAARFADPGDLPALAKAAEDRGLLRDAARLRKHATAQGDISEAVALVGRWHSLQPHSGDPRPAQWVAAHAALDDPYGVARLLGALLEAGAEDQAAALIARDPASHAALENPNAVVWLLGALLEAGAEDQAAALIARDPASHAALDDPRSVVDLLDALQEVGAEDQAAALIARDPASHAALDEPYGVVALLGALLEAGAEDQAAALAARVASHAPLDDPGTVADLLYNLREAGAEDQAAALAARVASHAPLDDPAAVAALLGALQEAGVADQAAALAADAALDDPGNVARLLDALQQAGEADQAAALIARDPASHAALDNPAAVADLLYILREAGAEDQATALIARDPASHAALDNPGAVARLLVDLREAGAEDQAAALIARDPASHAALENPYGTARLLGALQEAGATDQAAALATRAASHASLDNPYAVMELLGALREAGATDQADALAARAASHAPLDDPRAVADLLGAWREAGAEDQAAALIARDPASHASLDDPRAVVKLLRAMQAAGATDQAAALAARVASHAPLDDPRAVADLLRAMQAAGATDQAAALIARDPASHAALDHPGAVADLLDALRKAGAEDQARTLVDRLPAEGGFALFCEQSDHRMQYRFGREADGSPAPSWGWEDLD
jgi:uncharacterized protein YidB (DUF937 family)